MKELRLNVKGMVCQGCENRVINCLNAIEGVVEVSASHIEGTVIVKFEKPIDENLIRQKIEDIGFEIL